MLTFTDGAKEKVHFYTKDKSLDAWGIRILAKGQSDFAFSIVELKMVAGTDRVIDIDDFKVVIDDISAQQLEGAKVDFIEDGETAGFAVQPPEPKEKVDVGDLDLSDPITKKVYDVLQNDINPGIASHGGVAQLLNVKDNIAYVQLGGGCQGCGMADVTLKQGIEVRIKEVVPEITQVIDQTDHASGTNPYFQPSK